MCEVRRWTISVVLIVLSGCVSITSEDSIGHSEFLSGTDIRKNEFNPYTQEMTTVIGRKNEIVSEYKYWEKEPTNSFGPKLCLSLSGGGLRAGTFALGVMRSLKNMGMLNDIDIISSVSGGSYTLSWYLKKRLLDNRTDSQIFSLPLANGTRKEKVTLLEFGDVASAGAGSIALIPANLVLNGLFGLNFNTSVLPDFYAHSLRNSTREEPVSKHSVGRTSWKTLAKKFLEHKRKYKNNPPQDKSIPFYIMSATGSDRFYADSTVKPFQNVFEFTPLWMGNDLFGYLNLDSEQSEDLSVAKVVSMSGAAFDTSFAFESEWVGRGVSAFNLDLGWYIPNYKKVAPDVLMDPNRKPSWKEVNQAIDTSSKWGWAPFPLYFLYSKLMMGKEGNKFSNIYLTDGGHSENLGLLPLIQRGCQKIIVVDAEHSLGDVKPASKNNRDYQFEALCRLKCNFDAANNKETPNVCKQKANFGHKIELNSDSGFSLDNCYQLNENGKNHKLKNRIFPHTPPIDEDPIGVNPVFSGYVKHCSKTPSNCTPDDWEIVSEIFVIKLSIDHNLVSQRKFYPDSVRKYYFDSRKKKTSSNGKISCDPPTGRGCFPQQTTYDQIFDHEQYNAYLKLGECISDAYLYYNDKTKLPGIHQGQKLGTIIQPTSGQTGTFPTGCRIATQ